MRALVRWLRDEDGLRGRVSLAAQPPAAGEMGAVVDAAVVVLTSGTVSVFIRSLFGYLKHRRTTSKVTLKVRDDKGRELELTCGSDDDAQATLTAVRALLEA